MVLLLLVLRFSPNAFSPLVVILPVRLVVLLSLFKRYSPNERSSVVLPALILPVIFVMLLLLLSRTSPYAKVPVVVIYRSGSRWFYQHRWLIESQYPPKPV